MAELRRRVAGRATLRVLSELAELQGVAQELAVRPPSRLLLCGGDGTYLESLSALHRAFGTLSLPPVAFVPAGTVNLAARSLHGRRSLEAVLERALSHAAQIQSHPTLRVSAEGGPERVAFTFGTGLVARFFQRYTAEGARGIPAAAGIVARVFFDAWREGAYARSVLEPLPCKLQVDGIDQRAEAHSLLIASTLGELGLHLRVTYRAGEDFSRPHLVATDLPPRRLAPQLGRVLRGAPLRGATFDGLVRDFVVRFEGQGPYVLDGDLHVAQRVQICAGPILRVLR